MKRLLIVVAASTLLAACGSAPQLGVKDAKFLPCPSAPHCVSSTDADADKRIAPIEVSSAAQWQRLQQTLLAMPRTTLLSRTENYLHVQVSTAIMRYKDDVELWYQPEAGEVQMRSSSRIGYYDFDTNRDRLEALRSAFLKSGV